MAASLDNCRTPFFLSAFRCDITPPLGHPLCGGWISPVTHIVDPLSANGLILQQKDELPIVLVALDWTGVLNNGYDEWRQQIAEAVGTCRERVFVHSVHQHAALWADPEAEILVRQYGTPKPSLDLDFFQSAIGAVSAAARVAFESREEVTHIGRGEAQVFQVASNRRVMGADGKVAATRFSACQDEEIQAAPEGLIDPFLKTISFWNGPDLLAALHFYATHPITHFGSGGVSADFVGLARDRLSEELSIPQIYFTGGAGNITPGKYNDGSPEMLPILAERVLVAMRASLENTRKEPLTQINWDTVPVRLPGRRTQYGESYCLDLLNDSERAYANEFQEVSERFCAASKLVWLKRVDAAHAINFGCLTLNDIRILCFPGEPFIEYQLYAQKLCPDYWVAFAGYGDGAPGYLPTDVAYEEGGFESGIWSYIEPSEKVLCAAIARLLNQPARPLEQVMAGGE